MNEAGAIPPGPRRLATVRVFLIRLCAATFPFVAALGMNGCAGSGPEPVRLTLISPHRDEIRLEVAWAFADWFRERTAGRTARAREALADWVQRPDPGRAQAADAAFEALYQDWQGSDLGEVEQARAGWARDRSTAAGQLLLTALEHWSENVPAAQLVWQDVGGGTSQIARYIGARFESNPEGIGIDLLFGGGTDIFIRFADQGLLERLDLPPTLLDGRIRKELNGIPIYDARHRWYGPMLSSFGILYNRELLRRIDQPEPRHWADLGAPGLRGWVSAGDPRLTGSLHMVYEIILQGRGWEKGFPLLMRLGANTHAFIRDSGTLTRTVSSGEDAAAGTLDAMALSAVGRSPETMAFWLPEGETIINPDAIAVLKGAPRKELARAFVEFTLSDAGQKLFILRPGQPGGPRRYPLCRLSVVEKLYQAYPAGVRSIGAANPFQTGHTIYYDSKLGNKRWDALNDVFGAVILDAHQDLAAAWKAVVTKPMAPERRAQLERELFAPICSEEELMTHARNIAEASPRVRTATVNRWGEAARLRYRTIVRSASG